MPKMNENFKKELLNPLYYKFYFVLDDESEVEFYETPDPIAMIHVTNALVDLCKQGLYVRGKYNEFRKIIELKKVSEVNKKVTVFQFD